MLGPLADGIATVLAYILNAVQILIIASVLIGWLGADPNNNIVQMITRLTEPLYRPIRRMTRNLPQGPLDWAPTILFLIVVFLQVAMIPYIRMLGGAVLQGAPG